MRSLPAHWADHVRDGTPFISIVDVLPSGADTWTQFRWGERAVTIDGQLYEAGILLPDITIKDTVRITGGGGVATRSEVNLMLVDKTKELHRTFQRYDIEGRDVQISLAMMPLNLVRNSSFESPTSGNNFDYWTETPGASNSITRQAGGAGHGAQFCRLTCVATPGPTIQCDAVLIRRGTTVSLAFKAKCTSGSQLVRAKILWNGLYWNNSTRAWQVGATHVNFTTSTSWQRFTLENVYSATEPFTNADAANMTVLFENAVTGTSIDIDEVQLEARPRSSAYHGSRYDMTASELYPIYWGEVSKPKWDQGSIKFVTKGVMNRRHREIPIAKLTQDVNPDWQIPPDNLGKPFPMTYGDFTIEQTNELYPRLGSAAMGLVVNTKNTPVLCAVYFDRPGMVNGVGTVYLFSPDSQRFYREFMDSSGNSQWFPNSADCYVAALNSPDWLQQGLIPISLMVYGVATGPPSIDTDNKASFTNPDNVVDEDLSTFASLTLATNISRYLYVDIQKPQEFSGVKCFAVYCLAKVEAILNSGSGTRAVRFASYIPGLSGNQYPGGVPGDLTTSGLFDGIPSGGAVWDANEDDKAFTLGTAEDDPRKDAGFWLDPERRFTIQCFNMTGVQNVTYKLYAIGLRVDIALPLNDALVFRSQTGRTFGSTWGGRKTSANAVYWPPDIVEGILRHELGMVTGDINTGLFDQALTDYIASGRGEMAGQVIDRVESTKVIGDICGPAGMVYYVDGAGREALRVLMHGDSARTLRPRDFANDQIEPEFTDRAELFTDFTLKWGYVPNGDVYLGNTYCNRNASNIGDSSYETKCAAAYAALRDTENPIEYECKWINNETTAQNVLKFLIDWTRARRRIVKATGFLDLMDLEFGDRVDLQLEKYLLERDTDTDRPVFVPFDRTIKKTAGKLSVDMSFLEVIAP